jgi:hypothetical protein
LLTCLRRSLIRDTLVKNRCGEPNLSVHRLTEIRDTINEVIRMHELNGELLRTLILIGYKIKDKTNTNNTPMLNNHFYSLLTKAELLMKEIASDLPQFKNSPIRRKKTYPESDVDETEPVFLLHF